MKLIGLCGKIGAGKDTVADYLVRKHDFQKIVISDVIKNELEHLGRAVNREEMQNLGNEYREKYGLDVWAKACTTYAKKKGMRRVVISGIRTSAEIAFYREHLKNDFVLVAVKANKQKRFDRLLKRSSEKDFDSKDEIESQESREEELWDLYGKFEEVADYTIENNGSMVELFARVEEFLKKYKF